MAALDTPGDRPRSAATPDSAGGKESVRIARAPDPATLLATYAADGARLVARRLPLLVAALLAASGTAVLADWRFTPWRTGLTVEALATELAASAAALALLRLPPVKPWSRTVALGLFATVALVIAWYVEQSSAPLDTLVSAYSCLLTSGALVLQWGWRPQAALTAAIFGTLELAVTTRAQEHDPTLAVIALVATSVVSIAASAFVDRYRREAFVRASMLRHAAALQRSDYLLLDVIHRVQSRFIGSRDARELFDEVLHDLLSITGSEYGFVGEVLRRPSGERYLRTFALTSIAWDEETRRLAALHRPNLEFDNLDNLFGTVITSGEAVIANDPPADPRRGGLPPGHLPIETFLGVPFHHGGELVGMAGLANRAGGYDAELVAFLQPLLATCGNLIAAHRQVRQRERVEAALSEEGKITAAVARAGRDLNESLDVPVVLERLCRLTAELLTSEISATLLWEVSEDAYVPAAIAGMAPAEAALAQQVRISREFISMLFAQAEQENSVEIGDVPAKRLAEIGLQNAPAPRFLCLALRRAREIVGIQIVCARDRHQPFSRSERRIADGLARMAAMSLMNARLLGDLQRANRLKSEFVSTMSHELRTPLNVILGYAEMARDEALPAEAQRECLTRITLAGRDLLDLIEGTLEIGRIESGTDAVRLETVALTDLWGQLGTTLGGLPRRNAVTLDWGPAPAVDVHTDPRKLAVIVRNLVGNALKFTEHGSVRTDVLVGDGRLVVRVADTGIGIRAEDQQVIFEMFRQADGSDSRRYGGTGLGLYIVRRFVDQLGGTIAVESAPGEGSVFTVTLPCALATGAGVVAGSAADARA